MLKKRFFNNSIFLFLVVIALFFFVIISSSLIVAECSSTVTPENPVPCYNTSHPRIVVTYNDTGLTVYRTRLSFYGYDVSIINTTPLTSTAPEKSRFIFEPQEYLMDGRYEFYVVAREPGGSVVAGTQPFTLQHPQMWIRLISPALGIGNASVYNITLQTQFNATCHYRLTHLLNGASNLVRFRDYTRPLNVTGTLEQGSEYHILVYEDFIGHEGAPFSSMTIICYINGQNSTNESSYADKQFYVGYLTTPPIISTLTAKPNPIFDIDNREALLNVSTNQETVCTVSGGNEAYTCADRCGYFPTPHYFIIGDARFFTGDRIVEDPAVFEAHTPFHFSSANCFDLDLSSEVVLLHYNVTCTNLANLHSSREYTIRYELNSSLLIQKISPDDYVHTPIVPLTLQTNFFSRCTYVLNGGDRADIPITDRVIHTVPIALHEGVNTISVECSADTPRTETYHVTLDTVAPTLAITAKQYTCALNKLAFTFVANDSSGVKGYNFTVLNESGAKTVWNWSFISTHSLEYPVTFNNFPLVEGQEYIIRATTIDRAENPSVGVAESRIIASGTNMTSCDVEDPHAEIAVKYVSDYALVNITCQDADSGCQETFKYADILNNSGTCSDDMEYELKTFEGNAGNTFWFSTSITRRLKMCVIISDKNNNNVSLNKLITFGTTTDNNGALRVDPCINHLKDVLTNESDIDCGGFCDTCALNKTCRVNTDCTSAYCLVDRCAINPCRNGLQDNQTNESDVDCGGSCSGCAGGKSCTINEDCLSRSCLNGICEAPVTLGDDGDYDDSTCDPAIDTCDEEDTSANGLKSIIMLIGVVLIFLGGGYIVYNIYFVKPAPKQSSLSFDSESFSTMGSPSSEQKIDTSSLARHDKFNERQQEKQTKRKNIIGALDDQNGVVGSATKQTAKQSTSIGTKDKDTATAKTSSKETSKTTSLDRSVDDKKSSSAEIAATDADGFIELDSLDNTKKKDSTQTSSTTDNKDSSKEERKEDVFSKLLNLAKPKSAKSSVEEKQPEKQDAKTDKKSPVDKSVTIEKQDAVKQDTVTQDTDTVKVDATDPFAKLRALASKTSAADTVLNEKLSVLLDVAPQQVASTVASASVSHDAAVKLFEKVDKTKLTPTIFKDSLSLLVESKKISRETVSTTLFEFMDRGVLTKADVAKILTDLKLINK